jgi:hypothetical protein
MADWYDAQKLPLAFPLFRETRNCCCGQGFPDLTQIPPFLLSSMWPSDFALQNRTNVQHWDLNIIRSERVPEQPTPDRVGTKFSCTFDLKGRHSEVDYTIIKYNAEAKDLAQFEGLTSRLHSTDTLAFADVSDRPNHTELTASFDLNLRGVLSPFSFLMNSTMQSTCANVMKEMEKFIKIRLDGTGK